MNLRQIKKETRYEGIDSFKQYSYEKINQLEKLDFALGHKKSDFPQEDCFLIAHILQSQKSAIEEILAQKISWDRFDWMMSGISMNSRVTLAFNEFMTTTMNKRKAAGKDVGKAVQHIYINYFTMLINCIRLNCKITNNINALKLLRYYTKRYRGLEAKENAQKNESHQQDMV